MRGSDSGSHVWKAWVFWNRWDSSCEQEGTVGHRWSDLKCILCAPHEHQEWSPCWVVFESQDLRGPSLCLLALFIWPLKAIVPAQFYRCAGPAKASTLEFRRAGALDLRTGWVTLTSVRCCHEMRGQLVCLLIRTGRWCFWQLRSNQRSDNSWLVYWTGAFRRKVSDVFMNIWTALATFLSLFVLEHFAREVKMWRK